MDKVSFEDFKKLELKIGKIISAVPVEKSEKLLKLEVDFGKKDASGLPDRRQVISGIAGSYSQDDLVGKSFVFVTNLEPRTIMGLESQAMILAAEGEDGPVCLTPTEEVPPGTIIS
ncbi:MAG TPA: methionine--tRNA ligase [Candidatus Nanoarchaeia archaeon]